MAESVIKRDKKFVTRQVTWDMGALVPGASGYATIPVTPALPTEARVISINVQCSQVSALSGLQLTPFIYSGGIDTINRGKDLANIEPRQK